jgi:hypothetical protein
MADLPRLPGIPSVTPVKDPTIAAILRPMKESIEILGNTISSTPFPNTQVVTSGLGSGFSGGLPATSTYDPTTDYTPPSIPTGFAVSGAFTNIILTWTKATYINHAYTEVWRANSNSLSAAVLQGFCPGAVYADPISTASTYYYWIRHVSQANVAGPFNSTTGTAGVTSDDPAYVMGVLSDAYGSTSQAPFFQLDNPTVINGVTIPAGTYIKAAFIADATITNAKIKDATIDNAKIATLDAAKINTGYLDAARIQVGTLDAKIANLDAAIITSGYINAARINTASIANASISTAQIASATITAAQIASGYIDAARINTASIANATISTAQIASATITAAQITTGTVGGDIASSGFSSGSSGWKIYQNGNAEFNGVVLSRQLLHDSGTFSGLVNTTNNNTLADKATFYIETNTASSAWSGTSTTFLALISLTNATVSANVTDVTNQPGNIQWGASALVVPITRWSGDARIFLKVSVYTRLVNYVSGDWNWYLYKVT